MQMITMVSCIANKGVYVQPRIVKATIDFKTGQKLENEPVILKENLPKVKGVAVVCKNGNETDREAIISVICSLFDISPENVGCVIG